MWTAAAKWKILGQEQDGFVISWESKDGVLKGTTTKIGFVDLENNILKVCILNSILLEGVLCTEIK